MVIFEIAQTLPSFSWPASAESRAFSPASST
jgi:hypothetical protein